MRGDAPMGYVVRTTAGNLAQSPKCKSSTINSIVHTVLIQRALSGVSFGMKKCFHCEIIITIFDLL